MVFGLALWSALGSVLVLRRWEFASEVVEEDEVRVVQVVRVVQAVQAVQAVQVVYVEYWECSSSTNAHCSFSVQI